MGKNTGEKHLLYNPLAGIIAGTMKAVVAFQKKPPQRTNANKAFFNETRIAVHPTLPLLSIECAKVQPSNEVLKFLKKNTMK